MNSIMSKDNKYVGQYLYIRDDEFSFRMFSKFYNLAAHNNEFMINKNIVKDLIHTGHFIEPNKIYVHTPGSEEAVLKSIKVHDYMVFI